MTVVAAAELFAQPVIDDRSELLERVQHHARARGHARSSTRRRALYLGPEGSGGDWFAGTVDSATWCLPDLHIGDTPQPTVRRPHRRRRHERARRRGPRRRGAGTPGGAARGGGRPRRRRLTPSRVRLALPGGALTAPQDASLHPQGAPLRVARFLVSHHLIGTTQMTSQATTHRTPSPSHAYTLPVVRELPSLPSSALSSAQTW